MAQPFVLDAQIRLVEEVLGLDKIKQQLAGIQVQTSSPSVGNGVGNNTQALLQNASASAQAAGASKDFASQSTAASNAVNGNTNGVKNATVAAKDFGDSVFIAGKRYAAFVAATSVAFGGLAALKEATSTVIDFDLGVTKLRQIIGGTGDEVDLLTKQIRELSVATGTSADDLIQVANTLAQAGIKGALLRDSLDAISKVPLLPTFDGVDQAVDGLIATFSQFNQEGLTASQIIEKVNQVSKDFAIESSDIFEGVKRGGSTLAQLGVSFDEFIGLLTTVRSSTRESITTIATAFKTIGARAVSNETLTFLKQLGIESTDTQSKFIGFVPLLANIKAKFDTLDQIKQIELAERLGGTRQVGKVLALLKNFDDVKKSVDSSSGAVGTLSEDVAKGLGSLDAQLNKTLAAAKDIARDLGPDLFKPAIEGFIAFANASVGLLRALEPIIPTLAKFLTIAGAIASLRIGQSLVSKFGPALAASAGGGIASGAASAPGAATGGLTAASIAQGALFQQALLGLTTSIITATVPMSTFARTTIEAAALITGALAVLRRQSISEFFSGGGLLPSLGDIGGGIATGALAVGAGALIAAADARNDLIDKITKSAKDSLEKIKIEDVKTNPSVIGDSIKKTISNFSKSLDIGGGSLTDTIEKEFKETGARIGSLLTGNITDAFSLDFNVNAVQAELNKIFEADKDKILEALAIQKVNSPGEGLDGILKEVIGNEKVGNSFVAFLGGIDKFSEALQSRVDAIEKTTENVNLENTVKKVNDDLQSLIVPPQLTGELLKLGIAIRDTTDIITSRITTFEGLVPGASPGGVIRGPERFGSQTIRNAITGGGFDQLLQGTPFAANFLKSTDQINKVLDNFIISFSESASELTSFNIEDKVKEFAKVNDLPPALTEALAFNFKQIAKDFEQAATEGSRFINPGGLKSELEKNLKDVGLTTKLTDGIRSKLKEIGLDVQPAIVDEFGKFVETSFRQIQSNISRLSTIRAAEIEGALTPVSRLGSLNRSLGLAGISTNISSAQLNIAQPSFAGNLNENRLEQLQNQASLARAGVTPTSQRITSAVENTGVRSQLISSFLDLQKQVANASTQLSTLSGKDLVEAQQNFERLQVKLVQTGSAISDLGKNVDTARRVRLEELAIDFAQSLKNFDRDTQRQITSGQVRPDLIPQFLEERGQRRQELEIENINKQTEINEKFDTIVEEFKKTQVDSIKIFDEATKLQSDSSSLFKDAVEKFDLSIGRFNDSFFPKIESSAIEPGRTVFQSSSGKTSVDISSLQGGPDFQSAVDELRRNGFRELTPVQPRQEDLLNQQNQELQNNSQSQQDLRPALDRLSDTLENVLGSITPNTGEQNNDVLNSVATLIKEISNAPRDQSGSPVINTDELVEKLQAVTVALSEPTNLKLDTQNRFDINIEGIDKELQEKILPLLTSAAETATKSLIARAFQSLAGKSADTESQIAFNEVANELGTA